MNYYNNIVELTGNTPLVKLNKVTKDVEANIFAKLEYFNPGLSVKDRIARQMIEDAEARGDITEGTVIIEPTSGNTGIGLALNCAVKGYRLILTMPESMSIERRKILKAYGAEIVLVSEGGMQGSIAKAEELMDKYDNTYMPQQFQNPSNPKAHRENTAQEIWRDLDGKVDIFVAGVGTGGTLMGTSTALKEKNRDVQAVAVEPENSAVLSGQKPGSHKIQGMGAGFIPDVLDTDIIDQIVQVNENESFKITKRLAREEGIFVGMSAGAAVLAALEIASSQESKGKNIVVILPDTGTRYLSNENLFTE